MVPPPSQNGLNGGPPTGLNGTPRNGVNGSHPGVNGSGTHTAGIATAGYAPAPPSDPAPPVSPALGHPQVGTAVLVGTTVPVGTAVPVGPVTDEERTRFGVLLDRAAERGLLDSSEYELRLRQLAEATSTEQMTAIVSELPAFVPQVRPPAPHRSRSAIQSASRTAAAGGAPRRRMVVWVLMGVLVLLALVSLVILALSVGRLSRSRSSMPPPPPAATRPVSALRL
jgi:hypothetical protein